MRKLEKVKKRGEGRSEGGDEGEKEGARMERGEKEISKGE